MTRGFTEITFARALCALCFTALSALSGCSAPIGSSGDPGAEEASTDDEAILNGTLVTKDPYGYAYTESGSKACSGTMLSPQWVLVAGHCLWDVNSGFNAFDGNGNPYVRVWLGTSTSTASSQTSSESFVHPRWWDKATNTYPLDPGYDIGLIRVGTPFASGAYPHLLTNHISNYPVYVGDWLRCYGYGKTSSSGGGGKGVLQTALLQVTSVTARPTSLVSTTPTTDMIELATNSSQQQLASGDSGGSCFVDGWPYHTVGISDAVKGTSSYLVKIAASRVFEEWIDQKMHSAPASLGSPLTGKPNYVTSVSTYTFDGFATFVVAAYVIPGAGNSAMYMKVWNARVANWSAWQKLGTTGLPSNAATSPVGLAATTVSPGAPHLVLTVRGSNGQLYWTDMYPGTAPATQWANLSWQAAGAPTGNFKAGLRPAVGFLGARVDLFAVGSDSKVYTRWKNSTNNNTWMSNWTTLPGANNVTFSHGVDVAYDGTDQYYYLVGISNGGTANPNTGTTGMMTWLTGVNNNGTYGGSWVSWSSLGGSFSSGLGISMKRGGLVVYGIGWDNNLWHANYFRDAGWSEWLNVANGTYSQAEGVTLNASDDNADKLMVVSTDSNQNPVVTTWPK